MPSNPFAAMVRKIVREREPESKPFTPDDSAARQRLSEKIGYLSAMAIFRDLSRDELMEIERATTMITCPAGRIFYIPGETGEVLFLLKKGRVQIYCLSPEGHKLTIKILEPLTFFGEMALLGQRMYRTFAEALEDCVICVMSRQDVFRLLLSKPSVASRICEELAGRLMEREKQLEEMAFKSVPARLAALLLGLADETGEVSGYSHQALAELLGVYRETVTSTLDAFKARGAIEIGRKRIRLVDRKALAAIADSP